MDQPAHPPAPRTVLVTGATGTLGRPVVEHLLDAGARVRVTSRAARPVSDDRPYDWARCDLTTGTGIGSAVEGADTIVHCATTFRRETSATRRLVEAARSGGAAPHLVYVSIVGVDTIPLPYYRAKLASERIVETSGLPWTLLRATQFHDLIARLFTAQRRLPFVLAPKGFRFQPVEVTEVAARLAALALAAPTGRVPDLGGPEIHTAQALAAATLTKRVLPLPLPGRTARAFRNGDNLTPTHPTGTRTYTDHLTSPPTTR